MTNEYIQTGFSDAETVLCEDNEKLLQLLADVNFDVVVVMFDGADGMETVMTLRRQ